MARSNSLENINLQFRTIMGKMGLDEEKQNKLSHKLDLSKKIKTIISMQTLEERKKKISEYLERISNNFSLMSFLSLHCSLENGNKTLFSIFMHFKGEEIIFKLIKEMEGERVKLILEFVFMLLEKYEWESSLILEMILLKYLEIKFKSITFYKIIEFYIKKGDYEVIFKNTKPFGCVCSSYLSIIVSDCIGGEGDIDNRVEGGSKVEKGKINDNKDNVKVEKGNGKINDIKDNKLEYKNIIPLNELQPNYSLLISNLLDLLKKSPFKKEYVNYIEKIYLKKQNTILKKKCKSERLFEIIRIAEEKDLLDLVTCVIESVVIGGEGYVGGKDVDEGKGRDGGKEVKVEGRVEIKDVKKEDKKQENPTLTPNTLNQPTLNPPINTPNTQPPNNTQPSLIKSQPPTSKKKIIKKIIKKSTPLFSYEQLKWSKINKKGTIFEKVTKIDFKDKDLEPFIKKEIIKKENYNHTLEFLNKKITIFPDKKNYALNIALSRIKLSDKELKDKILKLEPDCNLNLIKQLLIYFPNEEEKGVLRRCTDGGEGGMMGVKVVRERIGGVGSSKVEGKADGGRLKEVPGSNGLKEVQGPSLPSTPSHPTPSIIPTPSTPSHPTSHPISNPTLLPPSILPKPTPLPPNPNRAESFFIEWIY
ncbi:hypothetical protein evm_014363 [Chilo suppressalis]|nr:hypothetical protein evm_014363 [Chilo suppressalis]